MVAKAFAGVLDGVSYVEPKIWPYDWRDTRAAYSAASMERNGEVLNCTVYSRDYQARRLTKNFQHEAWFNAGADLPWGSLPLVFDRRDPAREAALLAAADLSEEPLILTSFSGTSAPFPYAAQLLEQLRRAFPWHRVLDLSNLRAERIYDVLALLERADAFVCTDSALLHLATAVPSLPVCALIPEHPAPKREWCRAEWSRQQVFRCLHGEALKRFPEMVAAIRDPFKLPKIVHVTSWSGVPGENDRRRMAIAQASWAAEYSTGRWECIRLSETTLPRTAKSIGDPAPLPFMRDLIEIAARRCGPMDIIALSNADVGFSPGLTGWVLEACGRHGAAFTHRWDFMKRLDDPVPSEFVCGLGHWYPGSDFFAFTRAWWDKNGFAYPDMVMGREACDMVLRQLIKQSGGVEIVRAIWHEKHASSWEQPGARETLAGNVVNRQLASSWLACRRLSWDDWRVPSNLALHQRPVAA